METPYEKLLVSLAQAEVKFIIVGGLAVALNGFVRATEDVDILVERSDANLDNLLRALSSFGEGHARELTKSDFDEREGAVRVIEEFPLDIFTVLRGKTYSDLIVSAGHTQIDQVDIRYLDARSLIALKEQSEREKDRIDVSALRAEMSK
jgi:hypothetical protein